MRVLFLFLLIPLYSKRFNFELCKLSLSVKSFNLSLSELKSLTLSEFLLNLVLDTALKLEISASYELSVDKDEHAVAEFDSVSFSSSSDSSTKIK